MRLLGQIGSQGLRIAVSSCGSAVGDQWTFATGQVDKTRIERRRADCLNEGEGTGGVRSEPESR